MTDFLSPTRYSTEPDYRFYIVKVFNLVKVDYFMHFSSEEAARSACLNGAGYYFSEPKPWLVK